MPEMNNLKRGNVYFGSCFHSIVVWLYYFGGFGETVFYSRSIWWRKTAHPMAVERERDTEKEREGFLDVLIPEESYSSIGPFRPSFLIQYFFPLSIVDWSILCDRGHLTLDARSRVII
jgi:hypothetical protein